LDSHRWSKRGERLLDLSGKTQRVSATEVAAPEPSCRHGPHLHRIVAVARVSEAFLPSKALPRMLQLV